MAEPAPGTLDFIVRQNPQKEAIVDGAIRRTYAEWDDRACRLANFLRDRFGLERGDRVAWMMHNRSEYYDLSFALQKLRAIGVPIGFRLTGPEAAYIVDDSDAKLVVCEGRFAKALEGALPEMPRISEDRFLVVGEDQERGDALPKTTRFEDAVEAGSSDSLIGGEPSGSIIYTSGTTGRPKGAWREGSDPSMRDALRQFVVGVFTGFGYETPDTHLVSCPLYHSAPPTIAGISHLIGGTIVVMRKWTPEEMLRLIQDEHVTSAFVVPTQLNRLLSIPQHVLGRYDLSSMKRLITGAAPFPYDVKRRVIELFPNPCLYEFYGSTETGINTIIGPADQLRKPGSCGKVSPGNEIRIVDDAGQPVAPGEVGTLYVKSPIVITGYHKKREATEECIQDGFFTVGDMARMDEEGFVYIVDRKKDMIISGGVNIYPAEIEVELRQHPAVYDCTVIGVPNDDWGEEVKAVVQLREGASATDEEIRDFLGQRLADYKLPRSVDFVEELPYNPSGKLLKKELRRRYWEAAGREI